MRKDKRTEFKSLCSRGVGIGDESKNLSDAETLSKSELASSNSQGVNRKTL
ncbi:2120_t:CDS:2, partial [Dentiscutata heterogama]